MVSSSKDALFKKGDELRNNNMPKALFAVFLLVAVVAMALDMMFIKNAALGIFVLWILVISVSVVLIFVDNIGKLPESKFPEGLLANVVSLGEETAILNAPGIGPELFSNQSFDTPSRIKVYDNVVVHGRRWARVEEIYDNQRSGERVALVEDGHFVLINDCR